jgi:hypothetical protein
MLRRGGKEGRKEGERKKTLVDASMLGGFGAKFSGVFV